jgi:hypothetical protein
MAANILEIRYGLTSSIFPKQKTQYVNVELQKTGSYLTSFLKSLASARIQQAAICNIDPINNV